MWQAPERFDRMIAKVKSDALREAAELFAPEPNIMYSGLVVRDRLRTSADRTKEES